MHSLLLAALLAAASTPGQPSAPPPPPHFGPDVPSTAGPHSCASFYPPGPLLDGIEGTTTMSFTVGTDGHVTDPTVMQPSGNADLDDSAAICVKHWLYRPAQRDGKPVAAPWQAQVAWRLWTMLPRVSSPHCVLPPQAGTRPPGSRTSVAYAIAKDGTTQDVAVTVSSGDDTLDQVAADCVAHWRFVPPSHDGEPASIRATITISWSRPE